MSSFTTVKKLGIHACEDLGGVTQTAIHLFKDAVLNEGMTNVSIGVGRTQYPLFDAIAETEELAELTRKIRYFQLDEYWGIRKPNNQNLLLNVIRNRLLDRINHPEELRHTFNIQVDAEAAALQMERELVQNDGLDMFLTGLGIDDHIGWIKAGTPPAEGVHKTDITFETRVQNASLWGGDLHFVPEQGITMGPFNLIEAKSAFIMVSGSEKAEALQRLVHGDITPDVPSTLLRRMANSGKDVQIIADRAALQHCNLDSV